MIIATAGHVDHGKTLLVKALTGIDTDRLNEEKTRGLTIDLGFAYANDEFDHRLGFIDVPGHIKFINNMLAGVSSVDCALLVIAADDGPMPQTLEHLAILDLLGITRGVVAVTKTDRVDADRIEQVIADIQELIANSTLSSAEIFPLSAVNGEGIDDLKLALASLAEDSPVKANSGYFRMPIDRCFSIKGSGLVVTGSVVAGSLNVGDEVTFQPQGVTARVRSVHCQDQPAESAHQGDRCAINLAGHNLERGDISRGDWVTTNNNWQPDTRIDVNLRVLESSPTIRHRMPVHLHIGAAHTTARVAILEGKAISSGGQGLVQLVCNEPVLSCVGDRIIVRDQAASVTLAGGEVIDPHSPGRGRSRPERLLLLKELIEADNRIRALAGQPGGIAWAQLEASLNLPRDRIPGAELTDLISMPERLITNSRLADHKRAFLSALADWHEANPQTPGISSKQAIELAGSRQIHIEKLIDQWAQSGDLVKAGNVYSHPDFTVTLSEAASQTFDRTRPILAKHSTKPPVLHDLAAELDMPVKQLEKDLMECVKSELLSRPVKNRFFLPEAVKELRMLLFRANEGAAFTVKQYRDVTGVGRNLSIEILEYFDRQGITRRRGDLRDIVGDKA